MIVCHCAAVTDSALRDVIRRGACNVKDVVRETGAGRRCAPCREEIASLIASEQPPAFAD